VTDSDVIDFDLDDVCETSVTLAKPVSGQGRYIREGPASTAFADLRVSVSRHRGARRYRFEWRVPEGTPALAFMKRAALDGVKSALREKCRDGVRLGGLCISVVDGSYQGPGSNDGPVSIAAGLALRDALSRADLVEAS
jgi:hypothetical protein